MSGIPNSTIPNMALNIAMLHSYDKMWDYPFICIDPHILCISNHTSPIVRSTEMQGIRQHILHIWLHLQQPVSQFDLWRSPFANPASDCICLRASRMHRFHHSDGHCWPDRGAQGQDHWCCCLCSRSTRGSPSSHASEKWMNARLNGLCLNYAGYLCRGWVVTLWISWPMKGWRLASIGMDMATRHNLVDWMVMHGSTSGSPLLICCPASASLGSLFTKIPWEWFESRYEWHGI